MNAIYELNVCRDKISRLESLLASLLLMLSEHLDDQEVRLFLDRHGDLTELLVEQGFESPKEVSAS